jgi:hypothetical protein
MPRFACYQAHTLIEWKGPLMPSYTSFSMLFSDVPSYIFDCDVISLPNVACPSIAPSLAHAALYHDRLEWISIQLMRSSNYTGYMLEIHHKHTAQYISDTEKEQF